MGVDLEEQDDPRVDVEGVKEKRSLYIFKVLDVPYYMLYFAGLAWILEITCMPFGCCQPLYGSM